MVKKQVCTFSSKAPNAFHQSDHLQKKNKESMAQDDLPLVFLSGSWGYPGTRVLFGKQTFTAQLFYPPVSLQGGADDRYFVYLWSIQEIVTPLGPNTKSHFSRPFFLRRVLGAGLSEYLYGPIFSTMSFISISLSPSMTGITPASPQQKGHVPFSIVTAVSILCVVETCGSSCQRWLPLQPFFPVYTAHSLP